MKHILKKNTILIVFILILSSLTACNSKTNSTKNSKLQIVTTIFPEYDWVNQILGNHAKDADITLLLDQGVDLHSYQPTADDIVKISNCDLFLYVGGESDEWVDDVLQQSTNKNRIVINLLEVLGDQVKEETVVEGMQIEEEDEHHEEELEYDEHVWLSLRNAILLCQSISDALQTLSPDDAKDFQSNTDNYVKQLSDLDTKYQNTIDNSAHKTILFGDRFPFLYMTDDYNLNYYAAFVGCSAETEASFETVVFLANKIDELSLNHVLTIENSDHKIADTIIQNTSSKDQTILTLDSLQSTSLNDLKDGKTYLSTMQSNLDVLKEALN